MQKEIIFLVEEAPEGGYTAKALGHCICTEADSVAKLKKRVQEATRCHFEAEEKPRYIRLRVVKDQVIPV
ncbi:MAG: 2-oxoisovalerate dehydrogenase [Dehalococcoidia bacterium]|nr:2-oxoisovalerate dehydrogenase [Dehalococcoidia bacterium]